MLKDKGSQIFSGFCESGFRKKKGYFVCIFFDYFAHSFSQNSSNQDIGIHYQRFIWHSFSSRAHPGESACILASVGLL